MKIAIVGTGIAGNVVAHHLNEHHDITVYEQNNHIGGHSHTHRIQDKDARWLNIDTGFIVLNDRTYPEFNALLRKLDVGIRDTEMSFSVKCERSGLEYNGNNLNTLFAQRRNLISPKFHRMIRDILRFNREATALVVEGNAISSQMSLGEYLRENHYSDIFIEKYIIPMGAAIWSTRPEDMFGFPAAFFFRFFHNHGLLTVNNRPQWSVIDGGSRGYVDKLTAPFRSRIRTNCPVRQIRRDNEQVSIITDNFGVETYDYVFIASHSDQALGMLEQRTEQEDKTLSAIRYQPNEAVLHTDTSLLPETRLAWASWNYQIGEHVNDNVTLTYDMNILQGIESSQTFCVTLNNTDAIDPDKIIKKMVYDHPLFTTESIGAQQNHRLINGTGRTYYCGAYWRNGFHEDGVVSALTALAHFDEDLRNERHSNARPGEERQGDEQLPLRWAS